MAPVQLVQERSLGLGWLEVSRRILEHGLDETYDGAATKELALVTLVVGEPDPEDELIASLADPDWLAWMKRNFTEPDDVPELGNARSYAKRLRDYDGRDQVAWVIERLRADPETRSATITTFQPLADTSYIPCVSLLDFWRSGGALELVILGQDRVTEHVAGSRGRHDRPRQVGWQRQTQDQRKLRRDE